MFSMHEDYVPDEDYVLDEDYVPDEDRFLMPKGKALVAVDGERCSECALEHEHDLCDALECSGDVVFRLIDWPGGTGEGADG